MSGIDDCRGEKKRRSACPKKLFEVSIFYAISFSTGDETSRGETVNI